MNKLEIINESISEIREILGAECANIEDLPEMVKRLVDNSTRNGFTTAFIFSSESHPNTPTGGSLDIATGLIIGIDGGWSQRVKERETTFRMRSTSEESVNNWMSFAIFNPVGVRVTEWSTPVNLKGVQGVPGVPGQVGAQGPEGPKGEKGDSANSYRTVSVYTTTETIDAPDKPIGGKWNLETNEVTPPITEVGVKWFLNADEPEKNNYLWMSQATFGETGDLINDWCLPFRLTGEAGKNGADGRVTEFIYRLVPDFETYKKLKPWTNKLYSPEYEDDKVPLPNDDLNLSTKWTDQPSGITESMQIEVCCTRTRKGVEQSWSAWSTCVIWSKWGEDGMDGDGVEYIYLVTPDKTNEDKPIDSQYVLNYFTPDRKAALDDEYYQQDEFCFNGAWGYTGYDWSDEPKDVGPGKPLEWVMIRKKKKNGKGEVVWGEFSNPAIWGRFAEDGLPYLTSFVFTRSIETPAQPTGGSYEKPMPDQSIWSDSVPVISETMKGPVWMSTRVFYAGDINAFDKDWTIPKIIADTHDFQVEYSKGNENGLIPHLDPFTGNEGVWRAKQEADYGIVWGDDSQITDPIWMITSSCDNGVWKPWVLTRIKGEKGAAGKNGTSVEVRGKFSTLAAIKEEWREYAEDGTDFYGSTVLHNGDAYFVEENGMLYIYNGGFYPGEATTFEIYWAEVQLTGEKGDSFYFYVAYCETLNEGATLYFDTPKKYIGTIVSDKPLEQNYLDKWSSYKNWTKWLGEDGWGQEQIFLLTSKDATYDPAVAGKKPLLPVNEEGKGNVKEYLPLHGLGDLAKGADDQPDRWADSPLTVSEDYPYCWVVSRSVPEFGAWKGDGPYVSLYSRYSYDGASTISVNLTNDLVVIPMEGDEIDSDFITNNVVTTGLQVFVGDESVPSDRTTVSIEGGYATWDEKTDIITLNFDKLPANVNEIPIVVTVDGGSKHTVTWKLFKTDTAYEILPDVHVIKRYVEGDKSGQLETKSFDVKVKKWDGEKWIASNKAVFVEIITKEEKLPPYSNQSEVVTETSGGIATVNIGEIHDIKAITVYLTNDDKDNGTRISFEDIAIIADGITGPQGPQGEKGVVFEISDNQITIPIENGIVDSDLIGQTTTIELSLFEGSVKIDNSLVKYTCDHKDVSIENGIATVRLETLGSVNELIFTATYKNYSHIKVCKIKKTSNVYEFSVDKLVLHRDSKGYIREGATFTLKKWSGNQWILYGNYTIRFTYKYNDGRENSSGSKNLENGICKWADVGTNFNQDRFLNMSLIQAEVTVNNIPFYQTIGVIGDGKNGTMTEEEKNAIKEALSAESQANFNAAKQELSGEISVAQQTLQKAIDDEKSARESGDQNAINVAQSAVAEAAAYIQRLQTVEGSITNLNTKIDTETGEIKNSILTKEQVYDLSIAALGADYPADKQLPGDIHANTVFGRYMSGAVGVFGDLFADQLKATVINTNVLKTYNSDNEGITIEGDDIVVHKTGGSNEIMRITGDNGLTTIPVRVDIQMDQNSITKEVLLTKDQIYSTKTLLNDTFVIEEGIEYIMESPSIKARFVGTYDNASGTSDTIYLYGYDIVVIYKEDVGFPDNLSSLAFDVNAIVSVSKYVTNYDPSFDLSGDLYNHVFYWNGAILSTIDSLNLVPGEYKMGREIGVYASWTDKTSSTRMSNLTFSVDRSNLTIIPVFEKVLISSGGMQYIGKDNTYFSVKKSGTMIMRNGNNALGVDSTGTFIIKDGRRYEIPTTGTGTLITDWTKYQ